MVNLLHYLKKATLLYIFMKDTVVVLFMMNLIHYLKSSVCPI